MSEVWKGKCSRVPTLGVGAAGGTGTVCRSLPGHQRGGHSSPAGDPAGGGGGIPVLSRTPLLVLRLMLLPSASLTFAGSILDVPLPALAAVRKPPMMLLQLL